MIDAWSASLCAFVLLIAGVLELLRPESGHRFFKVSAKLAAFGFFMLSARFFYLIQTDDLSRLNIFGTASIGAIALSRILACTQVLRQRL